MTKTNKNIISATNANKLFWLGRYEERVYTILHLLRKCYDKMIDGHPDDYASFWNKFHVENTYLSNEEFEFGMLYDENNPNSVLSAQIRAMDNAMVLRSCIMSESLSYLEMSKAKLLQCKNSNCINITNLQPITDWSLAFFGSVEQRIENHMATNLIQIGRNVEYIDMLLRFNYPLQRIRFAFENLEKLLQDTPSIVKTDNLKRIRDIVDTDAFGPTERDSLLSLINSLITV